jgi:hypothetical protein
VGCLVCGKPLAYHKTSKIRKCELCARSLPTTVVCERGHYVCDDCHCGGALALARQIALNSATSNPHEIALAIMHGQSVNMHGPEHHVIVGFALAAAYCNAVSEQSKLPKHLDIIVQRGGKVPGGTCGYWGACGAAVGAGIFLSAVFGVTPMSGDDSYGLCNLLTAECLTAIGNVGGPRCCKRNVALAIRATVTFLRERLGIALEWSDVCCEFSSRNRECIGVRCPWSYNR